MPWLLVAVVVLIGAGLPEGSGAGEANRVGTATAVLRADGIRYTLDLSWGKLRVSAARMLMRQGGHLDVQTRNAVASVRGTDFIVETLEAPGQAQVCAPLSATAVGQGVGGNGSGSTETVVTILSGVVELSNRPPRIGRMERVRASETSRVRGRQDPVRLHTRVEDLE